MNMKDTKSVKEAISELIDFHQNRIATYREMMREMGLGTALRAKPGPKPKAAKGKPGPKPKAKPGPKPKAEKAVKAEKAPKGKRARLAYPADDIVLGALTQEPQGISDIAEGAKSDPKLTVVVVKKLVKAKKVLQEGGGRWTTYRLV